MTIPRSNLILETLLDLTLDWPQEVKEAQEFQDLKKLTNYLARRITGLKCNFTKCSIEALKEGQRELSKPGTIEDIKKAVPILCRGITWMDEYATRKIGEELAFRECLEE